MSLVYQLNSEPYSERTFPFKSQPTRPNLTLPLQNKSTIPSRQNRPSEDPTAEIKPKEKTQSAKPKDSQVQNMKRRSQENNRISYKLVSLFLQNKWSNPSNFKDQSINIFSFMLSLISKRFLLIYIYIIIQVDVSYIKIIK